jgi:hypothetical protein
MDNVCVLFVPVTLVHMSAVHLTPNPETPPVAHGPQRNRMHRVRRVITRSRLVAFILGSTSGGDEDFEFIAAQLFQNSQIQSAREPPLLSTPMDVEAKVNTDDIKNKTHR